MRPLKTFGLAAVLVLGLAAAADAQRVATQKRGTGSAVASFAVGDIDAVGLFNGSLTVNLSLQSSPTGPAFKFGLQLSLNSASWDYNPVFCTDTGPYELPEPDPRYNSGHNWAVHLGRLSDVGTHWKYWAPDGSEIGLYDRLHPGYPATVDPNVSYSTNGGYLRLRHFPTGSAQCTSPTVPTSECVLLEFPDGAVHEFRPRTVATAWRSNIPSPARLGK